MLQTVTHATQLSTHAVMFARTHAGQTLALHVSRLTGYMRQGTVRQRRQAAEDSPRLASFRTCRRVLPHRR